MSPASHGSPPDGGGWGIVVRDRSGAEIDRQELRPDSEGLAIGSDAGAEIYLDDDRIEPFHAQIYPHRDRLVVAPETEQAAVSVDGRAVQQPTYLRTGSAIQVGPFRITIEPRADRGLGAMSALDVYYAARDAGDAAATDRAPIGWVTPAVIVGALYAILLLLRLTGPTKLLVHLLTATLFVGWACAVIGGIWLIVTAFQKHLGWGLLVLFVPFVSIVYIIVDWHRAKRAFLVLVVSVALLLGVVLFTPWEKPKRDQDLRKRRRSEMTLPGRRAGASGRRGERARSLSLVGGLPGSTIHR